MRLCAGALKYYIEIEIGIHRVKAMHNDAFAVNTVSENRHSL